MSGAVCALDVRSVSKSYGATVALQDVSIELLAGEVRALLGENGAGKSTLVKILSGVVKPNAGTMQIGGEPYEPRAIVEARRRGVATAFQELSLVPNLTVAQNLALPRQAKGKLADFSEPMGDVEDGRARGGRLSNEAEKPFGLGQGRGRLVEYEHLWIAREGARYFEPLALGERQFRDDGVGRKAQPEAAENRRALLLRRRAGYKPKTSLRLSRQG